MTHEIINKIKKYLNINSVDKQVEKKYKEYIMIEAIKSAHLEFSKLNQTNYFNAIKEGARKGTIDWLNVNKQDIINTMKRDTR